MHGFGSNQFAIVPTGGEPALYSAKATSAVLDKCFVPATTQDNGANFTWHWKGPWQSPSFYRRRRFPTPYFRKRLRQVRFIGGGQVDFSIGKDYQQEVFVQSSLFGSGAGNFEGSGTFAVDGAFGGLSSLATARVYTLGVANVFSAVFSATSNTADAVHLYVLEIVDRKDLVVS